MTAVLTVRFAYRCGAETMHKPLSTACLCDRFLVVPVEYHRGIFVRAPRGNVCTTRKCITEMYHGNVSQKCVFRLNYINKGKSSIAILKSIFIFKFSCKRKNKIIFILIFFSNNIQKSFLWHKCLDSYDNINTQEKTLTKKKVR